jgi:hypothetical protein
VIRSVDSTAKRLAKLPYSQRFILAMERATAQVSEAVGQKIDPVTAGPLTRDMILTRAEELVGKPLALAGAEAAVITTEMLGLADDAGMEEIAAALQKAAITTGTSADAMLDPAQADAFITKVSDRTVLANRMRIEGPVDEASGTIDKIGIAVGIIRAAAENSDDGYRAEPNFETIPYQVVSVRLPWEITIQFLRRNLQGMSVEDKIWNLMTKAFALDLERLDVLGDTASGDPALSIDDGFLKKCSTNASGNIVRVNLDNSDFGTAWPSTAHFYALEQAMPEKYLEGALRDDDSGQTERPVWLIARSRVSQLSEHFMERETAAGDNLFTAGGDLRPLGYDVVTPAGWPTTRIGFVNPKNLVRIMGSQIERYRVGPGTDWSLTLTRKRGYVFFLDRDFVIEEDEAVVDGYNVGQA